MTTKKSKKGKTIPLTDFLASESKLLTVRGGNWAEIVDKEEEEETKPIVVDIGFLPTAPRSAVDIDYSNVPTNPPFVAHVANLSFEIDDEGLRRIFADLNPQSARVMRDGLRSRGIGLVEFSTRENLIDGLKRNDKEVYGRKMRVNVSDKTDSHHHNDNRSGYNSRSHRSGGGEERPEMADKWKRAEPRSEDSFDDRHNSGYNRDRQNRGEHSRSNASGGGSRDQQGNDYGYGYPRSRDDRGGHSGGGAGGRDYNRSGQRNRYHDDDNRSNSGMDRPRYAGRYSDTRDVRERNKPNDESRDDAQEPPRERPRLHLQPRTKPLEENQPLSGSSSSVNNVAANVSESPSSVDDTSRPHDTSNDTQQEYQHQDSHEESSAQKSTRGAGASIFGGAKPVNTAAKELEIEKKLKDLQVATSESTGDHDDRGTTSRSSYGRTGDRDNYRGKRFSNDDYHHHRNRDRRDDDRSGHGGDHHRREYSGGQKYEDDNRRRNDDDHYRRGGGGGSGGGHDRDRYGGHSRRDNDSGRMNKYHQSDRDRGSYRPRDREDRSHDDQEFNNQGRSSNNSYNNEHQTRNAPRGMAPKILHKNDDSHKLELSNKFGMLDDDDLDAGGDHDEPQSPIVD